MSQTETKARRFTPDPKVANGGVARALDLFPDDTELVRLSEAVEAAFAHYANCRTRVDDGLIQWAKLNAKAQSDGEPGALKARSQLTVDLLHDPADIEVAALRFSDALTAWAFYVLPKLAEVVREIEAELNRKSERPDGEGAGYWQSLGRLEREVSDRDALATDPAITALKNEWKSRLDRRTSAADLTHSIHGVLASEIRWSSNDQHAGSSIRLWVARQREETAKRVSETTGLSESVWRAV